MFHTGIGFPALSLEVAALYAEGSEHLCRIEKGLVKESPFDQAVHHLVEQVR